MRQGTVAVVALANWVEPLLVTQFQGEWAHSGCWTRVSCLPLPELFLRHCLSCRIALSCGHFLIRLVRGLFRCIDLPQVLYLLDRRLSCNRST